MAKQRCEGRCCVGEEEADSSLWRHGSDDEGKFGEDRLKPAAGLSIVSEFVVATAQPQLVVRRRMAIAAGTRSVGPGPVPAVNARERQIR